MKTICIFEDEAWARFAPLTYTRPMYDLLCGMNSLGQRILRVYKDCRCFLHCRALLAAALRRRHPGMTVNAVPEGPSLWMNGRVLAGEELPLRIPYEGEETAYLNGDTVVAIRFHGDGAPLPDLSQPTTRWVNGVDKRIEIDVPLVDYPWELVRQNPEYLRRDFAAGGFREGLGIVHEGAHCINRGQIHIGAGAQVRPGAVLDAEPGPICIGEKAVIGSNAVVEGPAAIGPGTLVRPGTRIAEGVSLGPRCKVGGEIQQSILHGYSNKQHDGYLGHSYIGSWVNLGAGTTNSDLKNNYHTVKVHVEGRDIDTGSLLAGLIMGDHSKTGIGTLFNTGTVVGVCANIFGSGLPPKYVPSFLWGGYGGFVEHEFAAALATAILVMGRRDLECPREEGELLRAIFNLTSEERRAFLLSQSGQNVLPK